MLTKNTGFHMTVNVFSQYITVYITVYKCYSRRLKCIKPSCDKVKSVTLY